MRLLLIAIVFLVGCYEPSQVPDGHDAGGVDCATNSPPFIDNMEMNSFEIDGGAGLFALGLHFDWGDPGIAGATDRPNMAGGYISAEERTFSFNTSWITPDNLVTGCIEPVDLAGSCALAGFDTQGCSGVDALETCTQGSLTMLLVSSDGGFQKYQPIDLTFRVRDRCGDQSNSKSVQYEIGSGHLIENPPAR